MAKADKVNDDDNVADVAEDKPIIVGERDYVDLTDKKESGNLILKITDQGVTATHKAYKILQISAVNILRHVEEHDDPSIIDAFLEKIEDGYLPARSMGMFIEKHSPAYYDIDAKRWMLMGKKDPKFNPFDIPNACVNPWWKAAGKPSAKPYSFEAQLRGVIASYENHKKRPKKGDVFNDTLFDKVFKLAKNEGVLKTKDDSLNGDDSTEEARSEKVAA